ncbi:MAG: HAD-IA family hydrolase [Hyphomicrobiales bacterium]|nr:HAD-IA family hydrolase [Hyphomicrobiales bacterium]MCP5370207.1 HAD-IA family hydrolase [Hyphomicrobiales bacterium]
MPLQALIFDIDGTLAETEEAHRAAFNQAFEDFGLPWRWDAALYKELLAIAGGGNRLRHYMQTWAPESLVGEDATGQSRADLPERVHRHKTVLYTKLLAEGGVPLRPGVADLLRKARQAGLRLAVATGSSRANLQPMLTATIGGRVEDWFEVFAAGDTVDQGKPAPDIYRWVLKQLALPPTDCLVFEDSRIGLAAARAAGLKVVITPTHYTHDEDFTGALRVLDSLAGVDPLAVAEWLAE